jgi:hypothetical protein
VIGNETKFVFLDEELAAALRRLPLLERCVITLAYFYDQTQQQMAAYFAVPLPAIAQAAARGLRSVAADLAVPGRRPTGRVRIDLVAQLLSAQPTASETYVAIAPVSGQCETVGRARLRVLSGYDDSS